MPHREIILLERSFLGSIKINPWAATIASTTTAVTCKAFNKATNGLSDNVSCNHFRNIDYEKHGFDNTILEQAKDQEYLSKS